MESLRPARLHRGTLLNNKKVNKQIITFPLTSECKNILVLPLVVPNVDN